MVSLLFHWHALSQAHHHDAGLSNESGADGRDRQAMINLMWIRSKCLQGKMIGTKKPKRLLSFLA